MKVEVYFNLHRKMWSVRDAKTKLVLLHAGAVVLKDAKSKVSQAGRERVLRERRKNVHAYLVGEYVFSLGTETLRDRYEPEVDHATMDHVMNECDMSREASRPITYNPYKYTGFVYKDTEEPFEGAPLVGLDFDRSVQTWPA